MSARFKIQVQGREVPVVLDDDFSVTTEDPDIASMIQGALGVRPSTDYEPDQLAAAAGYLVEILGGTELQIDRPPYLDDPPGKVY